MFHLIKGSAYLFVVLRASFSFLYTGLVTMFTYIVLVFDIYIYMMMMYVFFTYLYMCCFFSIFIHMFLIVWNLLNLFHTKIPWWVLFKVFQKYRLSKSFLPWTLFLQSFSRVCVRIRFYCIQQVIISLVIYESYFICLLWFCHELPKGGDF